MSEVVDVRDQDGGLTRRDVLKQSAAGAAVALSAPLLGATPAGAARPVVPLPSPQRVRKDFQRMVDFGPRLTGSAGHDQFIGWLEREFVDAGAQLLPCDDYEYERWSVGRFGLDVGGEATKVATYYTRSQETPEGGVSGPLVYAGTLPVPSTSGTDFAALAAGLAAYPNDLSGWATATAGRLGKSAEGSILVVDLPLPLAITAGVFLPIAQYLHWPGHGTEEWAQIDYKRTWIEPGLGVPLAPFASMGAAGVVFIVNSSFEALENNYLPFDQGYEPLPALFVDREAGRALRLQAVTAPTARLTLTATRTKVAVPSVTAVLPGRSKETVILNTHTDGQGFVEENGGVAFVHLARHFGSLAAADRLERTLVFAAWPGHMSGALPELEGWIAAHPDLVDRAAAALTIEHLGCTEWLDTVDKGYHATGEHEVFGAWVTQGKFFEIARDALVATGDAMARTALLRPPVQFGVGGAFQSAGVPQIGAIAGPEYLLTIKDNGDMDKLDEGLAAAQIAWIADVIKLIDPVPAADLRAGDPTLGDTAPGEDESTPADCGPADHLVADAGAGRALEVRFFGRRHRRHGVLVKLRATGAPVAGITVELRRGGRLVARSRPARVSGTTREVVLHRGKQAKFALGAHSLVVRRKGKVIARRAVRLGH